MQDFSQGASDGGDLIEITVEQQGGDAGLVLGVARELLVARGDAAVVDDHVRVQIVQRRGGVRAAGHARHGRQAGDRFGQRVSAGIAGRTGKTQHLGGGDGGEEDGSGGAGGKNALDMVGDGDGTAGCVGDFGGAASGG